MAGWAHGQANLLSLALKLPTADHQSIFAAYLYQCDPKNWRVKTLDFLALRLLTFPERTDLPFAWFFLTLARLIHRWNKDKLKPKSERKRQNKSKRKANSHPPAKAKPEAITLQRLEEEVRKESSDLTCYVVDKDKGFHRCEAWRHPTLSLKRRLFALQDIRAFEEAHSSELDIKEKQLDRLHYRDFTRTLVWGKPDIKSGEVADEILRNDWGKELNVDKKTIQNNIADILRKHKTGP